MPKYPRTIRLASGNYHAEFMVDGKRHSVTAATVKEVHRRIDGVRNKSALIPHDTRPDAPQSISLKKAIEIYVEERKAVLSPSTVYTYERLPCNRFKALMDRNIFDPSINWQKAINDESALVSAVTVRSAWKRIKAVLRVNGVVPGNVTLPQLVPSEKKFLDPQQIKRFLSAIKGSRYELSFLLGLHGLRCSEIFGLKIENLKNGIISVRGACVQGTGGKMYYKETNKNAASRRDVPFLIPRLSELIDELPPEKLLKQIPKRHPTLEKHLKQICRDNGLPKITMHSLRHSFASLCYYLNIPTLETMRLGGWANESVLRDVYTHLANKTRIESEERLKNFFK